MILFKKLTRHKQKLLNVLQGFPEYMAADVRRIVKRYHLQEATDGCAWKIGDETIEVPYRVHLKRFARGANDIIELCLLGRSLSGYMRQEAVEKLLKQPQLPDWALSYIFDALADYVPEVRLAAAAGISGSNDLRQRLRGSAVENPETTTYVRQRIISYWNEHDRDRWSRYQDYPPFQCFRAIEPMETV